MSDRLTAYQWFAWRPVKIVGPGVGFNLRGDVTWIWLRKVWAVRDRHGWRYYYSIRHWQDSNYGKAKT